MTFQKFGTPVKQETAFEIENKKEAQTEQDSAQETPKETQEETPTN